MFNVYDSLAVNLQILDSLSEYDSGYVEHCIKQTDIYKKITQHHEKHVQKRMSSLGYTSLYNQKKVVRTHEMRPQPTRPSFSRRNTHVQDTRQDDSLCMSNIISNDKYNGPIYGSHEVIMDDRTGDHVCTLCGLVVDDTCIDTGKGFRAFTSEERAQKDHYGAPTNEFSWDKGLPTKIGNVSRDCNGNMLSAQKQALHRRLKKWDFRYKTQGNKHINFNDAINVLKLYSSPSILDLPNFVQREVAHFYKTRVLKNDVMKGREIKPTVLTLIYLVCQKHKIPKTPEQICEKIPDINVTNFNRNRHKIMHLLKIRAPPTVPTDFINKLCNDLQIENQNLRMAAVKILKKTFFICHQKNLLFKSGKNPSAIAAASIYIACLLTNTKRTQDQIAKIANITNVTLRTRYQEICKIINIDPKDIRG